MVETSPEFHARLAEAEAFLLGNISDDKMLLGAQANPAAATRAAGFEVPAEYENEFNEMFAITIAPDLAMAKAAMEKGLDTWPSLKCGACQVTCYVVAAAIVAAGTAALSSLTASSSCVVALAKLVGCAAKTALTFITGLGTAIAKGVGAVVAAICVWASICTAKDLK